MYDMATDAALDDVSKGFRTMAHPLRLKILCHLVQGPKTVGELIAVTGTSQPIISQHLAKLKTGNILEDERCGQYVYYRLGDGAFKLVDALKIICCAK